MKAAFKKIGFNFIDGIVLINSCENPGIIQDQIAFNLALDNAATARSLKQLESQHYVRRELDQSNLRVKRVYPEPAGIEQKKKIDEIMDMWSFAMLEDFNEKEKDCILHSLRALQNKAIHINIDALLSDIKI